MTSSDLLRLTAKLPRSREIEAAAREMLAAIFVAMESTDTRKDETKCPQ